MTEVDALQNFNRVVESAQAVEAISEVKSTCEWFDEIDLRNNALLDETDLRVIVEAARAFEVKVAPICSKAADLKKELKEKRAAEKAAAAANAG